MTFVSSVDMDLASSLFDALRDASQDGLGITRDAYGPGEQRAHALMEATARDLGLEVARDASLNLYLTLPGQNREAPCVMTGSHLDSVPAGGNFDGAAGVVAGVAVLSSWRKQGFVPPVDVTVMGIRAEESTWFPYSYLGSKAAFGKVGPEVLELVRADTGKTLANHLRACGGDPTVFGRAYLRPARIARFVELHIEQGPVLVDQALPVGIVTGIRGSIRYRGARVEGQYAHSGAVPRRSRLDAVSAASRLVVKLDDAWDAMEREGQDLVLTFGQLFTNPMQHAFSKVAGEVDLCVDVRSQDQDVLHHVDALIHQYVEQVTEQTGVRFLLGEKTGSSPAVMDGDVRKVLMDAAARLNIPTCLMPSGAGHDAAIFAQQRIPTGMIFVRNEHGSHNPNECMALPDFELGARLLAEALSYPISSCRRTV